ncbi:MAG: hypothetical protein A2033_07455 [Bacteroidetes bacterium GWA2_31_9]|nr:MAG: hypothetical protein A2033_07455 [Bacteroidetes bacterium GWA2_31_9]
MTNIESDYIPTITKEEINLLPLAQFSGEIILIDNFTKFNQYINELAENKIIGFDTESKPSFKKGLKNGVALLQLSTSEKAYIFRLNFIGIPDKLKKIFQDESIIKVGLAIRDDIKIMQKVHNFTPKSFIDICTISAQHNIEEKGLKKLAAIVLNVRISKSKQLSNWEAKTLDASQLVYAATDAWICYELYNKLVNDEIVSGNR